MNVNYEFSATIDINSLNVALESNEIVYVTFITKAATTRVMACTRHLGYIPQDKHDGRFSSKLNHESIVCIYDYQNSDWRAFRKDAIIGFEVV